MRAYLAVILCVVLFFAGCKNANEPLENGLSLRTKLLESKGCSFHTTITADYGEKLYVFSMNCTTDSLGNLDFTVTKPATISGITGRISVEGGAVTFDDKVLAFKMLADGQVTPVSAPWLFIKALRSGYLNGCTAGEDTYEMTIDDSYADGTLQLKVQAQGDFPVSSEIFWQGRRVVTLTVDNFIYL